MVVPAVRSLVIADYLQNLVEEKTLEGWESLKDFAQRHATFHHASLFAGQARLYILVLERTRGATQALMQLVSAHAVTKCPTHLGFHTF